jgi:transposase
MESTGVYWIPVYEILEERGFDVNLINARHLKNVPGKKTDVEDCQWIQQLHTYGLLQSSFRPDKEMVALRSLVRHRDNLIRYRASHVQHMQKALHEMNLQLDQVISDITGVTGIHIIRDIVAGQHDPHKLAQYRDCRCAKTEEEIGKALQGNYTEEHVFELKQALELYDVYTQKIGDCDTEIEKKYSAFKPRLNPAQKPLKAPKRNRKKPRGNEPTFELRTYLYQLTGVDFTQIDGLDVLSIQQIISETGLDMGKWSTVKHFTSWLCLSPYRDISGGRTLRTATRKTRNRANKAFRLAAQSLNRSKSALGAFYRRMHAKFGPAKAIVATAHKLARIFYHLLKNQEEYVDPGEDAYEQQYRERAIKNLKRKAAQLGMRLEPMTS